MKNKINKLKGFTLVELLIVIALIAILSVAVLATINPIEQSNKAKDSTIQNDAAEVMNAYERYYTVKFSYPWVDIDSAATVGSADLVWFGTSNLAGAALCTSNVVGAGPNTLCNAYNNPGLLISTDELKDSFLAKGYTSLTAADPNYKAGGMNYLWVDKKASTAGNSIYVCFIPKAKSNRTSSTTLYKPTLTGGVVTGLVPVDKVADFTNGYPSAAWTFATPATSMFKCVP
jgi:prepilin-type N-terminal cleavage/methylation domain-containing protein